MESFAFAAPDEPAGDREPVPPLRARLDGAPGLIDLDRHARAACDEADAAGLAPIAGLLGTLAW